jgi:hypothetical protein
MRAREHAVLATIVGPDLVVPDTAMLLAAVANPATKRLGMAAAYAVALRMEMGFTDWEAVNHAIVERWSLNALQRIKRLAWKLVEEQVSA